MVVNTDNNLGAISWEIQTEKDTLKKTNNDQCTNTDSVESSDKTSNKKIKIEEKTAEIAKSTVLPIKKNNLLSKSAIFEIFKATQVRFPNYPHAAIVKEAFADCFSDKQLYFHLGKKFTKLETSFSALKISSGNLILIKIKDLGKGTFKKATEREVYENINNFLPNTRIAMLKTKMGGPGITQDMAKIIGRVAHTEFNCLEALKGLPNVLQIFSTTYTFSLKNNQTALDQILLTELFPEGNLDIFRNDFPLKFSTPQKNHIAHGLLKGLVAVHSKGIVHCDINLTNILVKIDPKVSSNYYAAISDFGSAKPQNQLNNAIGTYWYMAPELWLGLYGDNKDLKAKVSAKLDVWSMGCALWELMNHKFVPWTTAFPDCRLGATFEDHKKSKAIAILSDPKTFPEPKDQNTLEWLIWKMLRPNPDERYSAQEALNALEALDAFK